MSWWGFAVEVEGKNGLLTQEREAQNISTSQSFLAAVTAKANIMLKHSPVVNPKAQNEKK